MINRTIIIVCAVVGILLPGFSSAGTKEKKANPDIVVVDRFDPRDAGRDLPQGWQALTFDPEDVPRKSRYEVVRRDGEGVLKASTQGGASAIYRRLDVDPKQYPYISWRWRVDQVFPKADVRKKEGDDYPARLYVAFKYDRSRVNLLVRGEYELAKQTSPEGRYPPLYVLNYVWTDKVKENTWFANPWRDQAKMVIVRSGKDGLKEWHRETRNYLEDFRAVVGEEPTPVEYIGVMIDGDQTGSEGVSYFDDIELRRKPPKGVDEEELKKPVRVEE